MAERLGWIGGTRRATFRAWLDGQLAAWWSEWSTLEAASEYLAETHGEEAGTWRLSADDLAIGTQSAATLAGALTGLPADAALALAHHIGDEALDDLVRRLGARPAPPSRGIEAAGLSISLTDARRGALAFVIRIGGVRLDIRCARPLVDRVAPPPRPGTGALVGRRSAVGETTVRLGATLDLGDIALAELADLRPGDVIATQASLDTATALTIGGTDGTRIAHARLGARDGRRALLLTHS